MDQFLKIIAEGYKGRYRDISRLTFVMPNKRSGSFLIKQFNHLSDRAVLAPRVVTITDFVAEITDNVVDSRLDQLFRLYICYKNLQSEGGDIGFEKFIQWGETILSDFSEIDMQMVEAEEIFKNVTDLNEIRSNFLTPEQKEIMKEYFGYDETYIRTREETFWQNFSKITENEEKGESTGVKKDFFYLWQLLYPLYSAFKANLSSDKLTTGGGAYREAADKIENGYSPYGEDKVIFVGFNALSESERRIFKSLKTMKIEIEGREEPKADFVWDKVSTAFFDDCEDPAQKYIEINMHKGNFPSPLWLRDTLERNVPSAAPEIDVISVPSNVMQVKIASEELKKFAKEVSQESIKDAKVAVILPDESLLLPLLYSLPEEYPNPNLTMGFPLKHTPVISFAFLLRRLHSRSRLSAGKTVFFFEDVKNLLGHPYCQLLFSRKDIRKFIKELEDRKSLTVSYSSLSTIGDASKVLFRYIGGDEKPEEVVKYIYEVMSLIKTSLYEGNPTYLRSKVESTYIDSYLDELRRLHTCIKKYKPVLGVAEVFNLADRLLAGETVAFEGEPLEGLQVMGVLETRCLDFERIIMLSVNERVMPRVGRNSTFIPNAVRIAFGMPPANYQEEIFAYYFFRLLGRSRKAVLTYDSRSSNARTPGISRYLLQLKYLPGKVELNEREAGFGMPVSARRGVQIQKEGPIKDMLVRYDINSGGNEELSVKNFSATALAHYFDCHLKFLFNDVLELYIEREKIESIDAIDLGTIVHEIMENLYLPNKEEHGRFLKHPRVMTAGILKNLLSQRGSRGELLIEEEAKKAILKTHFHVPELEIDRAKLSGSAAILLEYIVGYVKNIIKEDMRQTPFRLWGCEIKEIDEITLDSGQKIRLKMVIDRLDQEGESDPDAPFRIVDYKTGSVHLEAGSYSEIFDGTYSAKNIFQLLLYARLLIDMVTHGKELKLPPGVNLENFCSNLKMVIYNIPKMLTQKAVVSPKIMNTAITDVRSLEELESKLGMSFMEILKEKIEKILDPAIPFQSEPDEDKCRFCDYRLRCEVMEERRRDTTEKIDL